MTEDDPIPKNDFGAGGLSEFGIDPNRIDPRSWSGVCRMLAALMNNPHLQIGMDESQLVLPVPIVPDGRHRGGGGEPTGAFHRIYVNEDDEKTYLQGGTISAGSGTVTIPDIEIIDDLGDPAELPGIHLYIRAVGNGIEVDGLVLQGYNLTAATVVATVPPDGVPDDTLPLTGDITGKLCHISLGVFTETSFLPNLPGNIGISYCPGSYAINRF
jgi:hypothetical protein